MVIFSISGSLRHGSSNTYILETMKDHKPAGVEFLIYEGMDTLPHFNPDLDNENAPSEVLELRGMINRSNIIIISTPEYAHGIPGSLKNVLDWLVSTTVLDNKQIGIVMGSSSEGSFAKNSLVEILKTMNAKVSEEILIIPGIRTQIDRPETWEKIKKFLEHLILNARLKS